MNRKRHAVTSLSLFIVACTAVIAAGGVAPGCVSAPDSEGGGEDEVVGESEQALSTCVTIQRGTLGNVEDATISPGITVPGWSQSTLIVSGQAESLLKFDLSAIPSGAAVTSAMLNVTTTATYSGAPIWARYATAPWNEGTVTFASFNQQVNAKVAGSMVPNAPNTVHSLPIKPATVQGWLDGTIPNYGLVLETMITQPPQWRQTFFDSSEVPTVANRPALQVCYVLPCTPSPCQNGGTCQPNGTSYTCQCPPGYTGQDCQINVDDCSPSPCLNGGACVDGVNSFTCACPLGFTGSLCEINVDDCAGSPCLNGGTCVDGVNSYSCQCPAGFTGSNCAINIDDCNPNPCQNGGACVDGINSYSCNCQPGFTGADCEIDIDDCSPNPCQNGGTCTDGINSYSCQCPAGFTGTMCEIDIDDCSPNPCQNGGTCTDGINSYSCQCPAGFTGAMCEINIDDCSPNPCQNGGTCTDGINSYTCQCPAGFTGAMCEINVDDCTPNPCQNGGTCADGINGYACTCPPGFTGVNCEINVNDCNPNPCLNGGTCADGVNGYTCQCPQGYTGQNCEIPTTPPPPELVTSATYAPSDGLAYVTVTVTPRAPGGAPLGAGLIVEVMSTDPAVTLGGTGTSACTVNAPSATCLKAFDAGAGGYVITAKRSSASAVPVVFSATVTTQNGTSPVADTDQVTFDTAAFQGGAGCAGVCGTTISSGTVTLTSNHAGGRNLYITGGTVTFDATTVGQTLGDVFISGGTVTHLQGTNAAYFKLDVVANSWNFLGGTINTSEKGYGKTCFSNGSCSGFGRLSYGLNGAPSSALAGPTDVYGASHGGMGSGNYRENFSAAPNTHAGNAGPTYDDYRDPRFPGATNSDYSGFHGGGVTRVNAQKTCVLAGAATVLASSSFNGAGGSINLRCGGITSVAWTGTLNADGGPGSGNSSIPLGAGGGGRIALVSTGDSATITGAVSYPPSNITARVHAYGGAPANTSYHTIGAGGAGTIYLKHSGLTWGDLIVANNSPSHYMNEGTTRLPAIAGVVSANVAQGATSVPVAIQSTSFNGTYYDNSGSPAVTNPALTQNVTPSSGSAYNGVFAGTWLRPDITAAGGALFDPTNLVQVTNNTVGNLATGAIPSSIASGAFFRSIDVLDHLDISGNAVLETNGDIYVLSGNVGNHGAATMTFNGLSIFDTTSNKLGTIQYPLGLINVVQSTQVMPPLGGGTLVANNVTISGSGAIMVPAMVVSNDVTLTAGTLTTNSLKATNYVQSAGTSKHYPPLFKTSPSQAIVYSLVMNLTGGFTLNGGTVDVGGLGYPLGMDPQGTPLTAWGYGENGPLAATGVTIGFGAGHGGTGGNYTAGSIRGMVYDDYRDPRYPGGAAATSGGSPSYLSWRSPGGGVFRVIAAGGCKLASTTTIKAGAVTSGNQYGAAGGSVSMNCGSFDTTGWTGSINANGAPAYTQQSLGSVRAGGGGRIALVSNGGAASFAGAITYPLPTNTSLLQAYGGNGISATYTDGGAGTIYLKHAGVAYGQLLVKNNNQTHYANGGTTPLIAITGTLNGAVAPGATTLGVTIASAPLHSSASFNGLLRGVWLRPDTSVNNADPLTNNLVLIGGNAFVSASLSNLTVSPALAAAASGAAFKSIDILNKYDVVGGAVVSTAGDIYIAP